jgi:hypothetical protein
MTSRAANDASVHEQWRRGRRVVRAARSRCPSGNAPQDYYVEGDADALLTEEQKLIADHPARDGREDWYGLALSGGGIRSAIFCLGAAQALCCDVGERSSTNLLQQCPAILNVNGSFASEAAVE